MHRWPRKWSALSLCPVTGVKLCSVRSKRQRGQFDRDTTTQTSNRIGKMTSPCNPSRADLMR